MKHPKAAEPIDNLMIIKVTAKQKAWLEAQRCTQSRSMSSIVRDLIDAEMGDWSPSSEEDPRQLKLFNEL